MRRTTLLRLHTTALVTLTLAVSFWVLVTPAHAVEVLPVESVSPADGTTFPLPTEGILFEIASPIVFNSPECLGAAYVAVSSQDVLNAVSPEGGRLANDFQVDYRAMTPSQAYPGVLWAVSGYVSGGRWWSSTPGTYYWQVEGRCLLHSSEYLSPIYRLTIAPPPSPASPPPPAPPVASELPNLELETAYGLVDRLIEDTTGHAGYRLHRKCRNTGATAARCQVTWATARHLRARTFLYSGTFTIWFTASGPGWVTEWAFSGSRERVGCIRRSGAKHCASQVRSKPKRIN